MKSAEEAYSSFFDGWTFLDNPHLKVSTSSVLSQPKITMIQDKREIIGLLDFIIDNLKTYEVALEIGLGLGGTHMLFRKFFPFVVSVDNNINSTANFLLGLSGDGSKVVYGDSSVPQTRDAVVEVLGGCQVDFLFIDGNHSYTSVKSDFANYEPLVKSGGIIGFHDTKSSGPKRLVREMESGEHLTSQEVEFTHFIQSGRMGISCYVKP